MFDGFIYINAAQFLVLLICKGRYKPLCGCMHMLDADAGLVPNTTLCNIVNAGGYRACQ
jgi:hypothetical protein